MKTHEILHDIPGIIDIHFCMFLQSDVDKCKTDLYHAVINSLVEAEKKTMQTVAVSSISSGKVTLLSL